MNFVGRVKSSSQAASLAAQKPLQKRRKRRQIPNTLATLNSLADALNIASEETQQADQRRRRLEGKGACKKRTRITAEETVRLQEVLNHPQYQADPFAAIQSHLEATLPPSPKRKAAATRIKKR